MKSAKTHRKFFRPGILIVSIVAISGISSAQRPATRVGSLVALRVSLASFLPGGAQTGETEKCGFGIISAALHHRQELSPEGSIALQHVLVRPAMEAERIAGKFRIHYDTTTANTPALLSPLHTRISGTAEAYIDSVVSMLSYVYRLEVDSLGYAAPPPDGTLGGGTEYDVYVQELGSVYGFTTPDVPVEPGGTCISCIQIDNDFSFVTPDSNKGLPALRVTLAHEFHHALQIGCYGYWTSDIYFYEMTSVWMEDVSFTGVNDYYNYVGNNWSYSHFQVPEKPFATNDNTMYSRGLWCHFLAKRFGRDAMKKCWEEIRARSPIQAMDRVLHQYYGSSFSGAFGEWAVWNFFTGGRSDPLRYYPEGQYYGTMAMHPAAFEPPLASRTVEGTLDNFSTRYHQILRQGDDVVIALSLTNVNGWGGGGFPRDSYSLRLSSRSGESNFTPVGTGVSVQLAVASPLYWQSAAVFHLQPTQGVGITLPGEGEPFPQPFVNNGNRSVTIPIEVQRPVRVTLSIINAGMDLVTLAEITSWPFGSRQAVSWDGLTKQGERAASGVYLYVLEYTDPVSGAGDRIVGKLAVVKQ